MEDIMADIRRAVTDEQAGKMALRTAETRQATGGNPEAGLLSRKATAAVGSAFSTAPHAAVADSLTEGNRTNAS